MLPYLFHRGALPLLISVPHAGTAVPDEIARTFTGAGRELPDTDWYVDQLYSFAEAMGASIITATWSRYVVDLNRSADSRPLYASNATSPVCPTLTFAGQRIYETGTQPDADAVANRIEHFWRPYHQCIAEELWRIRSDHGHAALWDAHSIASEVPALFAGKLPEFNLGTRDHASCPQAVVESLLQSIQSQGRYCAVLNGRFKGGYITMAYGRPADRVLAIQLELAQRTYMTELPRGPYDVARASEVSAHIRGLLTQLLSLMRA